MDKRANEKHGIPSVIGCIDGTHVRIIAPAENKHLYYNRKGYYSLNVMLMCDDELKIRYVDAFHPGASHDSFIWNVSELRTHLEDQRGVNFWLLGDAGYPLEPWLMTPHWNPDEGSIQMKFNEAHSKCRNIIERTNGVAETSMEVSPWCKGFTLHSKKGSKNCKRVLRAAQHMHTFQGIHRYDRSTIHRRAGNSK
ncbi:putative nuclease HARBI1 [Eurosta solidaginis]|uniref:putative nuclease HARBI1 n=1 Tax=Eurosta solidaginis TaxID=178769 RepID=UPI0035307263